MQAIVFGGKCYSETYFEMDWWVDRGMDNR